MMLDDFISLLDRHGADFSRWPSAERADAEALLAQGSREAWQHYRAATFIDVSLRHDAALSTPELLDKILAASAFPAPAVTLSLWQRGAVVGAVCASLTAGLFFGWSSTPLDYGYTDDVPGLTWSPGEMEASQ